MDRPEAPRQTKHGADTCQLSVDTWDPNQAAASVLEESLSSAWRTGLRFSGCRGPGEGGGIGKRREVN